MKSSARLVEEVLQDIPKELASFSYTTTRDGMILTVSPDSEGKADKILTRLIGELVQCLDRQHLPFGTLLLPWDKDTKLYVQEIPNDTSTEAPHLFHAMIPGMRKYFRGTLKQLLRRMKSC